MQDLTGYGNFNIPNIIFKHKNLQIFEMQELSISSNINASTCFGYFNNLTVVLISTSDKSDSLLFLLDLRLKATARLMPSPADEPIFTF
jgi:hypothetical protein